ncbi:MAG: hypothetical protein HY066_13760 [Betaproteobacteria bacterium]|nr:hypothetical protein [Betaproteobacteria bacterium]
MPRKQSDVERSLTSKGFHHKEGDHNYYQYYSRAGKKTAVFTKTSHGTREIDDSLLGRMARQCKLSRADFDRLIDCPLDRDGYETKLISLGTIESQPA